MNLPQPKPIQEKVEVCANDGPARWYAVLSLLLPMLAGVLTLVVLLVMVSFSVSFDHWWWPIAILVVAGVLAGIKSLRTRASGVRTRAIIGLVLSGLCTFWVLGCAALIALITFLNSAGGRALAEKLEREQRKQELRRQWEAEAEQQRLQQLDAELMEELSQERVEKLTTEFNARQAARLQRGKEAGPEIELGGINAPEFPPQRLIVEPSLCKTSAPGRDLRGAMSCKKGYAIQLIDLPGEPSSLVIWPPESDARVLHLLTNDTLMEIDTLKWVLRRELKLGGPTTGMTLGAMGLVVARKSPGALVVVDRKSWVATEEIPIFEPESVIGRPDSWELSVCSRIDPKQLAILDLKQKQILGFRRGSQGADGYGKRGSSGYALDRVGSAKVVFASPHEKLRLVEADFFCAVRPLAEYLALGEAATSQVGRTFSPVNGDRIKGHEDSQPLRFEPVEEKVDGAVFHIESSGPQAGRSWWIWSPDGKSLYYSHKGSVRIVNTDRMQSERAAAVGLTDRARAFLLTSAGLVVVGFDQTAKSLSVWVLDPQTLDELYSWSIPTRLDAWEPRFAAIGVGRDHLALQVDELTVLVINLRKGTVSQQWQSLSLPTEFNDPLTKLPSAVRGLATNADGDLLVAAGGVHRVRFGKGGTVESSAPQSFIQCICTSPDNRRVAVASVVGQGTVLNSEDLNNAPIRLALAVGPGQCAFDPKGDHLWTASRRKVPFDGSDAQLLRIPAQLKRPIAGDNEISQIAVSSDGQRVIIADKDINYLVELKNWVPTKRRNVVGER